LQLTIVTHSCNSKLCTTEKLLKSLLTHGTATAKTQCVCLSAVQLAAANVNFHLANCFPFDRRTSCDDGLCGGNKWRTLCSKITV